MSFDGTIDGIDHIERPPRRASMPDVPGLDVKRKEFSRQAALLHARDVCAIWLGWVAAQVEIVIRHRRRDVVVRVDDNRAAMNRERSLPQRLIARGTRLGGDRSKH